MGLGASLIQGSSLFLFSELQCLRAWTDGVPTLCPFLVLQLCLTFSRFSVVLYIGGLEIF